MKQAILYIRVSTDEQADKGFSLASQEEYLNKYCRMNNIDVIHTFTEDHSAKTFNRPEFKKMLTFCKQNRSDIDLLLLVKWDRFSRNTKDSYQMIYEFQN
jgi:site-specific DNA recombinase